MSATMALVPWRERPQWNPPVPPAQFWEFAIPSLGVDRWGKSNPHLWSMYWSVAAGEWRGIPPVPGSETLAWQLGLDAWRAARNAWKTRYNTPLEELKPSTWISRTEERYGFTGTEWRLLWHEGWMWGVFNERLY